MPEKPERLQKFLSNNGVAARREAEKMIIEGRVCINGVPATLGQSVVPGVDHVLVDGKPLVLTTVPIYLMLNKPAGYLSTVRDERGRRTVMELVSDAGGRIYPVGRLDLDTEGLLLFTNDGDFANAIMHPSFSILKSYEVTVRGDVNRAVELLRLPVSIDNYTVTAQSVKLNETFHGGGRLIITISEGRNRQIRKMCATCGLSVDRLKRISIGELKLGSLKTGNWRHLTDDEIKSLYTMKE